MENRVVVCKYEDSFNESVIQAVKSVEKRDNIGVAKTLEDIIDFKNNAIVFE